MKQKTILSCYLVQQFPMSHRVIPVYPGEDLVEKMIEGEESLYYVHFPEDQFYGKIKNIIDYLSEEDAGMFFSELIHIGFREAKLQYEKFAKSDKFDMTIRFESDKPKFTEAFNNLKLILNDNEIWQVCLETITYGMQSLFVLSYEDVFGISLN